MTLRGLVIAGGAFLGMMGVLFVVITMLVVADGDYGPAVQGVALTAVCFGMAAGSVKYGSNGVRPRVRVDEGGTTIQPDRLLDVSRAITILGLGSNVAYAGLTPAYDQWPSVPPWLIVGLRIMSALAAVLTCSKLWGYVRWCASAYLRLTPVGLEVGQGLRPRSCSWDQVRAVHFASPRTRWNVWSSLTIVLDEEKTLGTRTDGFTGTSGALRDLVDFYWQNPDCRDELVRPSEARVEQRLSHR